MAAPWERDRDTEIGADSGSVPDPRSRRKPSSQDTGEGTAETWQRTPSPLPPWPPGPSLISPGSHWEEVVAACSAQILPQQPSSRTQLPRLGNSRGTTPLLRGVSVIMADRPVQAPGTAPSSRPVSGIPSLGSVTELFPT